MKKVLLVPVQGFKIWSRRMCRITIGSIHTIGTGQKTGWFCLFSSSRPLLFLLFFCFCSDSSAFVRGFPCQRKLRSKLAEAYQRYLPCFGTASHRIGMYQRFRSKWTKISNLGPVYRCLLGQFNSICINVWYWLVLTSTNIIIYICMYIYACIYIYRYIH